MYASWQEMLLSRSLLLVDRSLFQDVYASWQEMPISIGTKEEEAAASVGEVEEEA